MSFDLKPRSLESVCDLITDGSHFSPVPQEEGHPIINAKDIPDGRINIGSCTRISHSDWVRLVQQNCAPRPGDVLLSKDGTIGRVVYYQTDLEAVVLSSIAILRPKSSTDGRYLAQAICSDDFRRQLLVLESGSALRRIILRDIKKLRLRFPSLKAVQSKIADILSTVDDAIEQTEALIAKHQQIKAGLMHDLFTRGVTSDGRLRPPRAEAPHLYKQSPLGWIPKEWRPGFLGDYIGRIDSGWSPNCLAESAGHNEWGVLKTTAVVWDGYQPTENKKFPEDLLPLPLVETQQGDILITRKGPVDRVGVVVFVAETPPRLMFPDTVFRTRLVNEEEISSAFLSASLGSVAIQKHWWQRKVGLADAQVNLNHGILRRTPITIPTPGEQEAVCFRLTNIEKYIYDLKSELSKTKNKKFGLMRDLLSGRVDVKAIGTVEV